MTVKPVELNNPVPRYYQVHASLLERIKAGEFQPGDAIPSERILVSDYQVSRITIVRALDLQERDGLIETTSRAIPKILADAC